MTKVYVIADTHFGHANIIRYCNRPFTTTEEMDKVIIQNWNKVVSNKDIVIHLGDVGMGGKDYLKNIISQLNGKKILIKGNHDNYSDEFYREAGFHTVSRFPIIYNNFFIMSHAPLQLSETTPYFNCYGHIHNDEKYRDAATSKCFCVERTGYLPHFLCEI